MLGLSPRCQTFMGGSGDSPKGTVICSLRTELLLLRTKPSVLVARRPWSDRRRGIGGLAEPCTFETEVVCLSIELLLLLLLALVILRVLSCDPWLGTGDTEADLLLFFTMLSCFIFRMLWSDRRRGSGESAIEAFDVSKMLLLLPRRSAVSSSEDSVGD